MFFLILAVLTPVIIAAESPPLDISSLEMQLRNRLGTNKAQTPCKEIDPANNNLDSLLQSSSTSERKWSQTDTVLA